MFTENQSRPYQMCTRCVMDTTDPDIVFDEHGYCNHCSDALKRLDKIYFRPAEEKRQMLDAMVSEIKRSGSGSQYNCIIGLSGGVDSSYLAYMVKQWGLKPLAFHIDNGWNTIEATNNIKQIVDRLNIDLQIITPDTTEFKELQLSFLRSSVIDLEMLSDNPIGAEVYRLAKKKGIKHFIAGTNTATEAILPAAWCNWAKTDALNIKDIYKQYGSGLQLKTYPLLSFLEFVNIILQRHLKWHSPLDFIEYDKENAKGFLQKELGWIDYGGKHFESIITRFYQAYILPTKFHVDKRKAHLSNLICSKQITRKEALSELQKPLYAPENFRKDKDFFMQKLGLNEEEFESIMISSPRKHSDFKSYMRYIIPLNKLRRMVWKKS